MATVLNNNIAEAIYLASTEKDQAKQPIFFKKVVQFLVKKRLLSQAPDILFRLNKIIDNKEGRIIARVSSVEKINEVAKKELIHNLSKHYAGKTIVLEEKLNPKLLGGYKIEVEDEVIDLTIKNRINALQEYLTTSKT